jgi:hypothetical protein
MVMVELFVLRVCFVAPDASRLPPPSVQRYLPRRL